ncbi:dihydrofolate reductase [Cordyceps fumosorosea ARSEF 2679]|uniref:Dihydrofolate reductase n=1 Tax=Cordyceps fumosorosea (strain ARSEF 2679) TaxID=1081104 RepID=A0A167TJL3_CORFA|nr:dihydrofolate reductase [Cordyceps fumosorosea ARSEF 2679]OAA60665.1 dihydrofolate reductase [Cordyceps fumosorosea ARSEF 2679]
MSSNTNGAAAPPKPGPPEKKTVKILMIHGSWPASIPPPSYTTQSPSAHLTFPGFTQNGPLFRAKTRALEKALAKFLAPVSLVPQLLYPTGPIRLRAIDMPFYQPPADGSSTDEPETWAWWRRNDATGRYRGIEQGMATLAAVIREAGGVDGVIGFSQGGCAAGVVAAALETSHQPSPAAAATEGEGHAEWAEALRAANGGRPLRFAVIYSGFRAADPDLGWLFEPRIATPTLHVLGSLDASVDEARSRTLIDACEEPLVVTHPGGHHVPVAKEWVMPLAGFIKQHVHDKELKAEL